METESRKLVEDAADLIKVNRRPSAVRTIRANLISCCKIRFAAAASDLRSDVLNACLTNGAPWPCWIAAMAKSRMFAAHALSKSSGGIRLSFHQLQPTPSAMPAAPAS